MKKIILSIFICFISANLYAKSEPNKILIVYYSLTGNTADVANAIQKNTGGDLFEIKTLKQYPDDKTERKKLLNAEIESGMVPKINDISYDLSKYNTIFIGSPVWANHLSLPVRAFLQKYDLAGKKIIVFVSHGGGGSGQVCSDITKYCIDCNVVQNGWSSWGGGERQWGISSWLDEVLKQ